MKGDVGLLERSLGILLGISRQAQRVQVGSSWDLVTTYSWAYNPIYSLANWPAMVYHSYKWVTSPVLSHYPKSREPPSRTPRIQMIPTLVQIVPTLGPKAYIYMYTNIYIYIYMYF